LKWAVFISGFGSNLQALLDLGLPEVSIALVVSNNPEAYGVERAKKHNVPVITLPKPIKASDWRHLSDRLKAEKIDCIFLLGFLRIVPPEFVKNWENQMLNLHPSLLPAYPGLKSIEKSYQDGAAMGVTVHWVSEGLDEGQILLQEKVMEAADTADRKHKVTLAEAAEMIHQLEHKLVIEAVKLCQKKQES
jgi:phosphoribosylglycinamide formyltransferase-1